MGGVQYGCKTNIVVDEWSKFQKLNIIEMPQLNLLILKFKNIY